MSTPTPGPGTPSRVRATPAAGPARPPRYLTTARELALRLPGAAVTHLPAIDAAVIEWSLPSGSTRVYVYARGHFAVQGLVPVEVVTALVDVTGPMLRDLDNHATSQAADPAVRTTTRRRTQ